MSDLSQKLEQTRPDGVMPSTRMKCMAGQTVFKQDGPANQAFLIEEGRVEVLIEEDGHTVKLAEICAGEIFGEMGVLEREARMATVRALENCIINVMTRDEVEQRLENVSDPVVRAMIDSFSKRLRVASTEQVKYSKNLASFQNRMAGLMEAASEGIDKSRRDEFAAEMGPLLDQVEAVLLKYRK